MPRGCAPSGGPQFDPDLEGPSPDDIERFGRETMDCPSCGAEVYDEAPFCHKCGHALGDEDATKRSSKAPIVVATVVVAILALVLWGRL